MIYKIKLMKSYFYIIKNTINGKVYYGSGSKQNYFGSGVYLRDAIKKYNKENFIMTILKEFKTREEAYIFEDRFLKLYKISSLPHTYNLKDESMGGDTFTHNPNKESIRLKMSISRKGKIRTESHCKNISISKIGKKHSDVTKKRMSESKQGEKNNMYGQGHKISGEKNGQYGMTGEKSPNFGKQHKPETIALMKEKARKGPRSPEEKKNMSEGIKRNMKYFIRQIDRNTEEIIEDHLTVKDASIKTGIKYHKVYSNLDENFMFTRVYKNNIN